MASYIFVTHVPASTSSSPFSIPISLSLSLLQQRWVAASRQHAYDEAAMQAKLRAGFAR